MAVEGRTSRPTMNWLAYRDHLTREEMETYLSKYPGMAQRVVVACPEHRLLALSIDGLALKKIEKSKQTLDEVRTALMQNGRALPFAPKRVLKKHPELYTMAVRSNGLALQYLPTEFCYEGMYEDAVKSNPAAFELIPEKARTNDLYLTAIRSNGLALRYVPKQHITKLMAQEAFALDVHAIEFIPTRFCSREMILRAVSTDGGLLEFVPKKLVDEEIASIAVVQNGSALQHVPRCLITPELCKTAIEMDPINIQYVPFTIRDDLAYEAVCQNWEAIRYIWSPSDALLSKAFEQSPLALEYFPEGKKTREICEIACARDPKAFRFVPKKAYTVSIIRYWLSSFFSEDGERRSLPSKDGMESLKRVNRNLLRDSVVASLMRRLDVRETKSARWVKRSATFFVTELIACDWSYGFQGLSKHASDDDGLETFTVTSRASDLDGLKDLLDGDFSKVEFGDYPFDDFDPEKHDLSSTILPVETLKRLGVYDDSAYLRLIKAWSDAPEIHNPLEDASIVCTREDVMPPGRFEAGRPFYYVSDMHLDYMLRHRFPKHATERQIKDYLADLVRGMVETVPESDLRSTLLVLGDTSHNRGVSELFYKELKKAWPGRIVCVLGNHELWDWTMCGPQGRPTPTIDEVVDKYREMLSDIGIRLLQNEALLLYRDRESRCFSKEQIDKMDDDELIELLHRSSYVLLGGLGFSGLNGSFNAEHGIYRDVLTDGDEDRVLSEQFFTLHERIRLLTPEANVIVATHTPISNWSPYDCQPGWIYVSGHTHRNTFREEGEIRFYADNQVGYRSQSAGLKRFYVEGVYDPFRHLSDGIHEVTVADYLDFNRGKEINVESFTRKGQILMLKREQVYLFLFKWEQTGSTYLLSGGRISRLEEQKPDYYYNRMLPYAKLVKSAFSSYMNAIRTIAKEVKAFGGFGRVHGCIVDIDFFNHVYLDPFTGRLKYYYATSVNDRMEYKHIDALLEAHVPTLLAPYKTMLRELTGNERPLVLRGEDPAVAEVLHKTDTLMYKPSNVIRSVQHLFDSNVIRVWNEDVLEQAGSSDETLQIENNRALHEG